MNVLHGIYGWKYYSYRTKKNQIFNVFVPGDWNTYYVVIKLQIIFNLALNAGENTYPIKKASNKSCSELNFVQKSPRARMSYLPAEWS